MTQSIPVRRAVVDEWAETWRLRESHKRGLAVIGGAKAYISEAMLERAIGDDRRQLRCLRRIWLANRLP